MRLKYYLRGLGVGIICTAILMGIALSGNKKEKLTDTEIIERAKLLGMVMAEEASDAGGTDSDGQGEGANTQDGKGSKEQDASGQDGTGTDVKNASSQKGQSASAKEDAGSDSQSQDAAAQDKKDAAAQDKKDSGQTQKKDSSTDKAQDANEGTPGNKPSSDPAQKEGMVEFEITERDHSEEVSKKLFEAGLISDASKFNQNMIDKKMDERLQTGKYQIPAGATEEEILEIIVDLP